MNQLHDYRYAEPLACQLDWNKKGELLWRLGWMEYRTKQKEGVWVWLAHL